MPNDPATLRDLFIARASADPDRLAYGERGRGVTFGELFERASELAAGLNRNGVEPGDRVALIHSAGVRFAELFWAIQLLGATPAAFNPLVPAETSRKRAERVRPKLVITDDTEITRVRGSLPDSNITSEDLAFLQPTSGTTGKAQAAMVRHRNVLACLGVLHEHMGIHRDDILAAWVPPWHDLGLVRFVIAPVYFATTCHIVQPAIRTIPEWLTTITNVHATISGAPDFAYRLASRLVDPKKVNLSSLRMSTNGGEPVRASSIRAFGERFDVTPGVVLPGYGLAEATLGVSGNPPGEPLRVDERGNVCCGPVLPNVEVKIDGDAPGEILVRGPAVFAGYADDPEATRSVLRDDWLYTGDTGYLDDEGRLYVLGRKRAMLKRGGAVLAPRELEEAAQSVEGVRIAAAVSVPDGDSTESIVVVVEHERSAADLESRVSDAIRRTSGFVPERVLVVGPRTIPRTWNGKVRHDALRTALIEQTLI